MTTQLTDPEPQLQRDRYGRPLIVPPQGGKPVPYTRATTLAGTLDDLHGLTLWKQRMTAIGITDRADLQVAVAAHRDDKHRLNKIVQDAMDAAAADAAATTGTALHSFCEQIDRGQELGAVPGAFEADLEAYRTTTRHLSHLHIEQGCVLDDLTVHGTPDRISEHEGELVVADIKTGSISFPGKIGLQLALYAHGQAYDHTTGQRRPWADDRPVSTTRAIIIHLPAGQGICTLHEVDIAAAWEAVDLAVKVRDWRKRSNAITRRLPDETPGELLAQAIAKAPTVEALNGLWNEYHRHWDASHTKAAAARKASLTTAVA